MMKTNVVEYAGGGAHMRGHLVYDDSWSDPRPAVIVVHDAFGLNDYAKMRARMLAELGYVAFAADLYGGGQTASSADEMLALYGPIASDRAAQRERLLAACDAVKAMPQVDAGNLSIVGYCLGGGAALELARGGADLRGVASFHGTLSTDAPAAPGAIIGSVLVCHGSADTLVPRTDLDSFINEMEQAGVDCQVNIYSGAVHAFTIAWIDNLNVPTVAYHKQADDRSWSALQQFLIEVTAR